MRGSLAYIEMESLITRIDRHINNPSPTLNAYARVHNASTSCYAHSIHMKHPRLPSDMALVIPHSITT